MAKRIFKIIGIVVASVMGFAGAFVGVMALMGKFDTPIVFPDRLEFENSEQMIVYDANLKSDNAQYFEFTLNGFSNSGNQVNQKNCYLTINAGKDLVTLYDKNKVQIEKVKYGYPVECDEPFYLKVNELSESELDDLYAGYEYGKVVIGATDEKRQHPAQENLTVWIDRDLKSIAQVGASSVGDTQSKTASKNEPIKFSFVASPAYSLNPISRIGYEDGKAVELYYRDYSITTGDAWVRVNDTALNNYSFLHRGDNGFYFETDESGTYEFAIAVFNSFEARDAYENNTANANKSNGERIAQMVHRYLDITVVDNDICGVSFGGDLNLNLYSDNYITLNGEQDFNGIESKNLQLQMKDINNNPVTTRHGNTTFGIAEDRFKTSDIKFGDLSSQEYGDISYVSGDGYSIKVDGKAYQINLSKYTIYKSDVVTRTIIDYLSFGDEKYYSMNNVAILKSTKVSDTETTYSLERLSGGSYLMLFDFEDSEYLPTSIQYTAKLMDQTDGVNKSWHLVVQEQRANVRLGIIVVNGGSIEKAKSSYVFDSVGVNLTTKEMNSFTLNDKYANKEVDLTITYDNAGDKVYGAVNSIGDDGVVATPENVTYDACVFVTKKQTDDKYEIDVVDKMVFKDSNGTEYVLVGYFDGVNFVNAVRAHADIKDVDTDIYLAQLKNRYGQTPSSVIEEAVYAKATFTYEAEGLTDISIEYIDGMFKCYNEEVELLDDGTLVYNGVSYTFKSYEITDTIEWDGTVEAGSVDNLEKIFNKAGETLAVNVDYGVSGISTELGEKIVENGGQWQAYEETEGCEVFFTSDNKLMLEDIMNTGKVTFSYELYNNSDEPLGTEDNKIKSDNCTYTDDKIKVVFNTGNYIANTYVVISLEYNDKVFDSEKIYLQSTEPTTIVVKDGSNDKALSTKETADDRGLSFNIEVGYDGSGYTYTYTLMNGTDVLLSSSTEIISIQEILKNDGWFLVNPHIDSMIRNLEVQSMSGKLFGITGDMGNYGINVLSTGDGVMKLTCGTLSAYIKVNISADNFVFSENTGKSTTTEGNQFVISDYLVYKYNSTDNIAITSQYVSAAFDQNNLLSGVSKNLKVLRNETTGIEYLVDKSTEDADKETDYILMLDQDGTSWVLKRNPKYQNNDAQVKLIFSTITNAPIEITFKFDVSVGVNWNNKWNSDVLYAGTKVLLAEVNPEKTSLNAPVFHITDENNSGATITVAREGGTASAVDGSYVYEFTDPGTYTISFNVGGYTPSHTIVVKPNAVITDNTESIFSGKTYNFTDMLTVYAFNVGCVYGKSNGTDSAPQYKDAYGKYTNLVETNNAGSVNIVNSDMSISGSTATAPWIGSVLTTQIKTKFKVYYGGDEDDYLISDLYAGESGEIEITVNNSFTSSKSSLTIVAMKEVVVTDLISINTDLGTGEFKFTGDDNDDFVVTAGGNLLYNAHVSEDTTISDVTLTFTWTYDGESKTVTWTGDIVVTPYKLEERRAYHETENPDGYRIFSNQENIELLSELFVSIDEDIIQGVKITSNEITIPYHDFNTTSITANIGYIVGDTQEVELTIQLKYKDSDLTYSYEMKVTIENRHEIKLQYPFSDLDGGVPYILINEADAKLLANDNGDLDSVNQDGAIRCEAVFKPYEPIRVGTTIDFASDEYLCQRVSVLDKVDVDTATGAIAGIELVGWQNITNGNKSTYRLVISGTTVTFNVDESVFTQGAAAKIILKITTTCGDFDYYFVHLYRDDNLNPYTVIGDDYTSTGIAVNYISGSSLFNGQSLNKDDAFNPYGFDLEYNSDTVKTYLVRATTLTGEKVNEADWYTEVSAKTIPVSTQYIAVELAFVYIRGNIQYYIGGLVIHIAPQVHENDPTGYVHYENGHSTGEYTKTLTLKDVTAKSNVIEKPFTFASGGYSDPSLEITGIINSIDYTIDGNIVKYKNTTILEISGTNIVINSYPTADLTFVIQYQYKDGAGNIQFALNVRYTIEAFEYSIGVSTFTVGDAFNTTEKKFNNTLEFSSILGEDYPTNKAKIGYYVEDSVIQDSVGNLKGKSYEATNSNITFTSGTFEFAQSTSVYYVAIKIELTALAVTPIKYVVVTVYPSIASLSTTGPDSGLTEEDAKVATENDSADRFMQTAGSTIEIKSAAVTSDIISYTIGGLTVYVPRLTDIVLSVDTDNVKYVDIKQFNNETSGIYEYRPSFSSGDTDYVNFAHMMKADVTAELKVSFEYKGNKYRWPINQGANTADSYTLYAKLPQTYDGLKAKYLVDGASYETLYSGDTIPNFLTDNLFYYDKDDNGIQDSGEVVTRLALSYTDDGYKTTSQYNPYAMGFTNPNSVNYVEIELGQSLYMESTSLNVGKVDDPQGVDTSIIIKIDNEIFEYWYHIMPNRADWLNYQDGIIHGYTTGADATDDNQYVTLLINDTDKNASYPSYDSSNEPHEFSLGNLSNGKNNILNISKLTDITSGEKGITPTRDGNTFTFSVDSYNCEFDYNSNTKCITFKITRDSGNLLDRLILAFDLQLEGGETHRLTIAVYNATIGGNFETKSEELKANDPNGYDLSKNNRVIVKFNKAGSSLSSLTYELLTDGSSTYQPYSGNRVDIINANNELFTLNNGVLVINAVGESVSAELVFQVKHDKYLLGNVVYQFTAIPNYLFKMGDTMFNSKTHEMSYVLEDSTSAASSTSGYLTVAKDKFIYTLDLAKLGLKVFKTDNVTPINNVKINISVDDPDKTLNKLVYVVADSMCIEFASDFTGTITLSLSIDHDDLGTYEGKLIINIVGFIDIAYKSTDVVTNSDVPFNSGNTVNVIAGSNAPLTATPRGGSAISYNSFDYKFSAEYVVLSDEPYPENGSQLEWDNTTNLACTWTPSSSSLKIVLPNVEIGAKRYVSIRINVIYYEKGNESVVHSTVYYYATYYVESSFKIAVKSSGIVDADKDISGDKLELFYYIEKYTNTNYQFIKYYDGTDIKLQVMKYDGVEWKEAKTLKRKTQYKYVDASDDSIFIEFNALGNTITSTVDGIASGQSVTKTNENIAARTKSYFTTEVTSIESFKALIDGIAEIKLISLRGYNSGYTTYTTNANYPYYKDNELCYKLERLDGGAFGINLSTGQALFNNELSATLQIVADQPIATYDNFKITTINAITAVNSMKLSSMVLNRWIAVEDAYKDQWNIEDVNIIGIGDPEIVWVDNANKVLEYTKIATINIPGDQTSEIYMVTYEGGGSELYNLVAEFYYLTNEIVVPDYIGSNQPGFYQMNWSDTSKSYTIDLAGNLLCRYYMDGTSLKSEYLESGFSITKSSDLINVSGTTVIANNDKLQKYKNSNPKATQVDIECTVTYGSKEIIVTLRCKLPDTVTSVS